MKEKLDKKDRRILYELDIDARQSFSQIAKKVRLSKEVVNYRIKRMEKLGIIGGYYTLINLSRLGRMCNRFFLKFKNHAPEDEKKIIDFFVQHPSFWWIVSGDGFIDIGIGSWEKTMAGCHQRKQELLSNFKPFLAEVRQSIYTGFYIYRRAYLMNKKMKETKPITYISEKEEKLDELDSKIIRLIVDNARMPAIDIAQKLNTTVTVVNYRLKKMQKKKIIEAFRVIIDLSKIGYYWYKVEFMLQDYTQKKKMLDYFAVHPHIVYAYESTGQADLEVEMEVESYEHFQEIMKDLRTRFKGIIETYDHVLWYKEHKILFFPGIPPSALAN